jgi:hypothetical protein
MNTQREKPPPEVTPGADRAVDAIIRGEDVLDEAREVAQKISGRVSRAVTERQPPDEPWPYRQ